MTLVERSTRLPLVDAFLRPEVTSDRESPVSDAVDDAEPAP